MKQNFTLAGLALTVCIVAASPAMAGPCALPRLVSGNGAAETAAIDQAQAAVAQDRDALKLFEACLADQRALAADLSPESLVRLDRQIQAASLLRRTLDAWQRAQEAARSKSAP